jgi:hypothetical protein
MNLKFALKRTPKIAVLPLLLLGLGQATVDAQGGPPVLTMHNDNGRTGQNLNEKILTPQNVKSTTFGKVFSYPVDGQIYAQPLYMRNVMIPNAGSRNVVFIATENDSVYAFDADGLLSAPLWHVSFINPSAGITTVDCTVNAESCNVYPIIGITGTPVIDPSTLTMYVLARTTENGAYFNRLHALDITTGAEKFGGPVSIQGSVPGTGLHSKGGVITFDEQRGIQRTAILLLNGVVYMGWSAGGGHGWVMGYNAQTLQQVGILNLTPNGFGGGVWQSDSGLAADSAGNIYFSTGDGTFDANTGGVDFGDSVVKMDASLHVLDYFAPMDQDCRGTHDIDLSSGGAMLLPPQGGAHPNELVVAGKGGLPCDASGAGPIYLVNRDNLGHFLSTQDADLQTIEGSPSGYFGNPAYWKGPTGPNLYFGGLNRSGNPIGDNLKQYSISGGLVSTSPIAQTPNIFPVGATPSISANGTSNGILWAVERVDGLSVKPGASPAVLYAYNAASVATELFDSTQAGTRDQAGPGLKFAVPTISNGRVYIGTQTELDVYGLLGPAVTLSRADIQFGNHPVGKSTLAQQVVLTNTGSQTLSLTSIRITGANPGDFKQTNTCGALPATLAAGTSCTVNVIFTASATGRRSAAVSLVDNAVTSPQAFPLWGIGTTP